MKKWIFPVSLCLISTILNGCEARKATAPRINVTASELQNFDRTDTNIEFHSNRLFLWPPHVTPHQVSRVLYLSDEIERLENKISPLKNRLVDLNAQLEDVEEQIQNKKLEVSAKTNRIKRKREDLRRKTEQLESSQRTRQQENTKEAPDAEILNRLTGEIQNIENQKSTLEAEIQTLESEKGTIDQELVTLSQNPLFQEKESLLPEIKADETLKATHLHEVMDIVTWYDPQPKTIGFHFEENGTVKVWISKWNLTRDEIKEWDFSTIPEDGKKPTIENVKYRELGGLFEFDVKVYEDEAQQQLREFYSFRIARTKYDSSDGKIYYTGTLKRTRVLADGAIEVRDGIAKLVDKNN